MRSYPNERAALPAVVPGGRVASLRSPLRSGEMTEESRQPVSSVLEADALGFARRNGITLWTDPASHYLSFATRLADRYRSGDVSVPVVCFLGSFLELLLVLEPYGAGTANETVLIHVPGQSWESLDATPLLELKELGKRYQKALDTLVREAAAGRVSPAELEAWLTQTDRSLEAADVWLEAREAGGHQGAAALLFQLSFEQVTSELLVKDTMLRGSLSGTDGPVALAHFLERHCGMDAAWCSFYLVKGEGASIDALGEALAGWLLSVEFVKDLRRPPRLPELQPLRELSKLLTERCEEQTKRLRREQPGRYELLADEVEARLQPEFEGGAAEELGEIDTFRAEETRMLGAALADLTTGNWTAALDKAVRRDGAEGFWLNRDQASRWTWLLVRRAGEFGASMDANPRPLAKAVGHDEGAACYVKLGAPIDRAHRAFELARLLYLEPRLPEFARFREILDDLRSRYRRWADHLARDFTRICREHGFLPSPDLQQRAFYERR